VAVSLITTVKMTDAWIRRLFFGGTLTLYIIFAYMTRKRNR